MLNQEPIPLRLTDIREDGEDVSTARVICAPHVIGVLTQVRRTMDLEELDRLADSILDTGQLHPGIVAVLKPDSAVEYLGEINELWGTSHKLADYTPVLLDQALYYFFLVAGHRRHRAVKQALLRSIASFDLGSKFKKGYFAELRFGITVAEAIRIQFQENIGTPPPAHEQAEAAWSYWRWRIKREPKLSFEKFSRDIGHKPDWFLGARRFCSLPFPIQEYVWGRGDLTVPYGSLVHLARLAEEWPSFSGGQPMPEEEMEEWLRHYIFIGHKSVKQFGDMVEEYLRVKRLEAEGQFSLFAANGSLVVGGDAQSQRPAVRSVVEPEMARMLHLKISWVRQLLTLIQEGRLSRDAMADPDKKAYSPGSPARLGVKVWEMLKEILPLLLVELEDEPGLRETALRLESHMAAADVLIAGTPVEQEQPILM